MSKTKKNLLSTHERLQIVGEYLRGTPPHLLAKRFKITQGYIRNLKYIFRHKKEPSYTSLFLEKGVNPVKEAFKIKPLIDIRYPEKEIEDG